MKKDGLKVTILPGDSSPVKEIHLPRKWLFLVFLVFPVLSLAGFFLLFSNILQPRSEDSFFRKKLARENLDLTLKVLSLKQNHSTLKNRMASLSKETIKTMAISKFGDSLPEFSGRDISPTPSRLLKQLHRPDCDSLLSNALRISQFLDTALSLLQKNKNCIPFLPLSLPVSARNFISRKYGQSIDPFSGKKIFHSGLDFSGQPDEPVFAAGGGTIRSVSADPFFGKSIRISHQGNIESFYAHLSTICTFEGQTVEAGQQIGTMGNSGMATGPHLHFEILARGEKKDPLNFLLSPPRISSQSAL